MDAMKDWLLTASPDGECENRGGSRILERGVVLHTGLLPKAVHRGV